ncbi:unnamed protein product [Choristocarpus tenellus]
MVCQHLSIFFQSTHLAKKKLSLRKKKENGNQNQQAAALKDKLRVLLCQRLFLSPGGSTGAGQIQQASKELKKKMILLGMLETNTSGRVPGRHNDFNKGGGGSEERTTAHTRWLDGASGWLFNGDWDGQVRKGASCDKTSLEIRNKVEQAKSMPVKQGKSGHVRKRGPGTGIKEAEQNKLDALLQWRPNPETPDLDRWGGKWGKPCGHNEVVMQYLRPFFPIEVINTRMCSKASPAPGNIGYDGCLELLSFQCALQKRALTVWDDKAFHFISPDGVHSCLEKQLLLPLPTPRVRFLVNNLRNFTLTCTGQQSPKELLLSIVFLAGLGAKQARIGPLSVKMSTLVMSFVLSGDVTKWKSISEGVSNSNSLDEQVVRHEGKIQHSRHVSLQEQKRSTREITINNKKQS